MFRKLTTPNISNQINITNTTTITQTISFNDSNAAQKLISFEQNVSFGLNGTSFSFYNNRNFEYYFRDNLTLVLNNTKLNRTNSSDLYNNTNAATARIFAEDNTANSTLFLPNGTNITNLTDVKSYSLVNRSNSTLFSDSVSNVTASGINASQLDALSLLFVRNISTENQTIKTNTTSTSYLLTRIG